MALMCFLGRHRPSPVSMAKRPHGGYEALCALCAVPLVRQADGGWRAAPPLAPRR